MWGGGGVGVWGFFFNDTATTEIYTLSLHDALPISCLGGRVSGMDIRDGMSLVAWLLGIGAMLVGVGDDLIDLTLGVCQSSSCAQPFLAY